MTSGCNRLSKINLVYYYLVFCPNQHLPIQFLQEGFATLF